MEVLSHWAQVYEPNFRMVLIGYLAIGLAGYSVLMMVWLNVESWREGTPPTEPTVETRLPPSMVRWTGCVTVGCVGYLLLAVGMMNHRRLPGVLAGWAGTGHTLWYVLGVALLVAAVAMLWTPPAARAERPAPQ